MFGKGLKLCKIFGFEIRIDASWLILAVLIILSLSMGYFPVKFKELSQTDYIVMGVIGALGLFASIIFHELCHSLVGRRFGIPMEGITLFMFGGMAQMNEESRTPKGEFFMAVAGPLASIALAVVLYLIYHLLDQMNTPTVIAGVVAYLAWINLILAIFNLLPAFPLDGGRILRAALWARCKSLKKATHTASRIGSAFGVALIVLGILSLLGGNLVGGLWWCLIGMFLRGVSNASYQQVVIRETLSGEPVERFMKRDPITVPSTITVRKLVEEYVYQHHFKLFPVVDDGSLKGCVTTRNVKELDQQEWDEKQVGDISRSCSEENAIGPDADATVALRKMNQTGNSRLIVTDNGSLAGIVSLKDMLDFLVLKLDLEGDEEEELSARLRQQVQAG